MKYCHFCKICKTGRSGVCSDCNHCLESIVPFTLPEEYNASYFRVKGTDVIYKVVGKTIDVAIGMLDEDKNIMPLDEYHIDRCNRRGINIQV